MKHYSLGLNSIINLSFDHPEAQSTLFTASQWKELKKSFPPKKYQIEKHNDVKKQLKPIIASYQDNRSWSQLVVYVPKNQIAPNPI